MYNKIYNYLTTNNIVYNKKSTSYQTITCRVPQDLMLGPLLFLIYVNDLHGASACINQIMFVDDTNSFCSSKYTKTFENFELRKISEWLKTNKISINIDNTNFILLQLRRANEHLPVKLLLLSLDEFEIKQVYSAKFLGVQIDENITWKQQITLMQNKLSKNLGLLFNAKKIVRF